MKNLLILISVVSMTLAGCAYPSGPNQSAGTFFGAGAGALAGSQIGSGTGQLVAVAVGALAGGLIGQDVGRSLDRVDQLEMQRSTRQALESARSNQPATWVNPDSGHAGSTTATRTLVNDDGRACREYQQTVTIAGKEQRAYGTACRQTDGSWRAVSTTSIYQRVAAAPVYQTPVQPVYYDSYPRYYGWPLTTLHFSFSKRSGHGHRGYSGGRYYGGHHYKRSHHKSHDYNSRHRYGGKYGGGHVYRGHGPKYGGGHSSKGYLGGSYRGGHSYKGYRGGGHGGHSKSFRRGGGHRGIGMGGGRGGGCRGRC